MLANSHAVHRCTTAVCTPFSARPHSSILHEKPCIRSFPCNTFHKKKKKHEAHTQTRCTADLRVLHTHTHIQQYSFVNAPKLCTCYDTTVLLPYLFPSLDLSIILALTSSLRAAAACTSAPLASCTIGMKRAANDRGGRRRRRPRAVSGAFYIISKNRRMNNVCKNVNVLSTSYNVAVPTDPCDT